MNITNLASMGYACGLKTLDEALMNIELHWDALSKEQWIELNFNLLVHQPDLSRLCADVLGPEQCKKEDDEMEAFFNQPPF